METEGVNSFRSRLLFTRRCMRCAITSKVAFMTAHPVSLTFSSLNLTSDGSSDGVGACKPVEIPDVALASFQRDGFLVVPGMCSTEDLACIREMLLSLFARQAGHAEGNHFDMLSPDTERRHAVQPQILKPSLYAPKLLRTRYFRQVSELARRLLGPDATLSFDHGILKRAGHAAATPWHQDEAHYHDPRFRVEQISFWLPLTDVDEHNGCMRYVPGSHLEPLLPHQALGNDRRVHALEVPARYINEGMAQSVPLAAGGCVLHTGLTLHASTPNSDQEDRLAYVLVFRAPPVARSGEFLPVWLNTQETAGSARHRRWLWRGGMVVLAVRWCKRMLRKDCATLGRAAWIRLRRLLR